jgi:Reverse transcriptase (RNA-dependent DNA polymerase)
LVLILALINKWETRQVDFILAYTQAKVECDMYMSIPRGFKVESEDQEYVLKLKKNLFGQKQAGRVWNKHLVQKLKNVGFMQSNIDECLFYKDSVIFILYTDDSILTGPNSKQVDQVIQDMKEAGLKLTVEGDIADFLGVRIQRMQDRFHLSQPHLIADILKELRLDSENITTKSTPSASSKQLLRHEDSKAFDGHFDYRKVIEKLNYLEKCSRPDITCSVHQAARFVDDPKQEHGKAIKWLGRYLKSTQDKGIIYSPQLDNGFHVYVDASFAGDWDQKNAEWDTDTARSRTGYVIMYANCPILWASKMQSEIALSSTESEYLAISAATREVLPIMELLQEMIKHNCGFKLYPPVIH